MESFAIVYGKPSTFGMTYATVQIDHRTVEYSVTVTEYLVCVRLRKVMAVAAWLYDIQVIMAPKQKQNRVRGHYGGFLGRRHTVALRE